MNYNPLSKQHPEKQILDDNARKFTCSQLDPSNLSINEVTSFVLMTDWLETGLDDEKKLAYKRFANGDTQILLIAKVTSNGKRITEKQNITEEEYSHLLASSTLRVEKTRQEFAYKQNGVEFSLKYDDFGGDKPKMLEVDASNHQDRDMFNPELFPSDLTEVTDDISYYGYRIAGHI